MNYLYIDKEWKEEDLLLEQKKKKRLPKEEFTQEQWENASDIVRSVRENILWDVKQII